MLRHVRKVVFTLALIASLLPIGMGQTVVNAENSQYTNSQGKIVIANRASGTISVIDVATDQVMNTIALPGPNTAEPMYVVYVKRGNQVFVGDRANNQVVSYDADTFALLGTVPAGNGVFHMWAGANGKQLWVNNDIDNTVTVIKPRTRQVIATVPIPADLVAQGGKPHDVIVGPQGKNAFVSIVGVAGANDYVVKFKTKNFKEVARAAVGKDPHLSLTKGNNMLYVPNQNGNQVTVLKRGDLSFVTNIPVPAAHGAGMRNDGKFFYTTNIAGGGTGGLVAIDIKGQNANTVVGATDTPFATPHNIALTPNGKKIYVTHSGGTADKVSIYTASKQHPVPVAAGDVTVGLNPFGLAYVP